MTGSVVDAPVVATSGGLVRGRVIDGVAAYLGIPYAAPPVGEAMFGAPRPAPPWEGVRPAIEYGPTAPQTPYPAAIGSLLDNVIVAGEDYLNLNIWTPDPRGSGLPVMVWIHGGAFTRGSNRISMYAGDTFARDGVVCVGINYRLGTIGFASLDGAPDNRGLLDQLAALRWVRENIAAFGGNPDAITIFGESAGAMSVATLLASASGAGLFARAIMQSGNASAVARREDARLVSARMAEILAVAPTAAAFAAFDAATLLRAQSQVALEISLNPDPRRWGSSIIEAGFGVMSLFPVVDGDVVTQPPRAAIGTGAGAAVPLLAGWNADEHRFFLVSVGGAGAVTSDRALAVLSRSPELATALSQRLAEGETPGDVLAELLTARDFAGPTTELAELRPSGSTYLYRFGFRSPQHDIRAGHAVETPFVFDHLDEAHSLTGPDPDHALAAEMHRAWVAFASNSGPGWAPHRPGAAPHNFG